MKRPYIICHMMTAVDGRIDCAEMEKLTGSEEYYATLAELGTPSTLSGRVTAQLELAEPGEFTSAQATPLGREQWARKAKAQGYNIVVDTQGCLLWEDQSEAAAPLLVITSEGVSREYLAYLDGKGASWIATGSERIDLPRAMAILAAEFGVERLAVVGGGTINAGFLAAGLLDEVSILLAPGIDGRGGMTAAFDGLPPETEPAQLALLSVQEYGDGAVWLRYRVK